MYPQIVIFTGSIYGLLRPAGAYRISTELRKAGYTVQVIDYYPQMVQEDSKILLSMINKFVGKETLWVGFSSTFLVDRRVVNKQANRQSDHYKITDRVAEFSSNGIGLSDPELVELRTLIKTKNPACKVVVGGGKTYLQDVKIADVYIEGYADTTVIDFTRWMEGKNPFFKYELTSSPVGQSMLVNYDKKASTFAFNDSQILWHESDYIDKGEALPIEISRGCIFNCSFCSYPLNGKKKLDYIKDPGKLIEEFTRNYELFGTTNYVYGDDTHNDSLEKLEILYDQVYSKLPFKIKFCTYLRLDLLNAHRSAVDLLLASGLTACFFGIESLNYESSKTIGKGIKPEKCIETLQYAKERWGDKVNTAAGFIIGLPHETEQTARGWLDKITSPEFPLDAVHIYPLAISIKKQKTWQSELERDAEKFGYKFDAKGDWYNEHLTKKRTQELFVEYIVKARKNGKDKISDFAVPSYYGLGYTHEELRKLKVTDSTVGVGIKLKDRRIKYFNKLLGADGNVLS